MTPEQRDFDLIIAGGGPVGLSLAAVLAHAMPGIRLAVCERHGFIPATDARASTIAAGGVRMFELIGVWTQLKDAAQPVEHMRITDSAAGDLSRPQFLSFDGDVVPGRPYAHLVPNQRLAEVLSASLPEAVRLIEGVEVTGLEQGPNAAVLALGDGRQIRAPLVVAADGARSVLRRLAGIGTVGHDYGQSGIVTTISHELAHEGTAYQHFRPRGPFASLPLPGRRSSLVWTESTAEARRLVGLPRAELAQEIEAAMGSVLGAVEIEGAVQAYPLRLQVARAFIAPRLVLVGDAAHVVHPIAGQGLNLGLKDVAILADVVVEALRLGLDHGAMDVLEGYQRQRRFDTTAMAAATDVINVLFSNDVAPVRAARDLGLGIVDRLTPLKTLLVRHAAGAGLAEPKLFRGEAL